MNSTSGDGMNDDDVADRALRSGLHANALSPEAMQRIRRATEAEWRAQVEAAPAPPRRRWVPLAAAASAILVLAASALTLYVNDQRAAAGALLGTVARVEAPGLQQTQWLRNDVPLPEGADLRVSQHLDARGDSLITLSGGGNLRVARASAFEVLSPDAIRLERGELYVDIPPGARASARFSVITGDGEFRHVGTQFAVAVTHRQTRLRVREGAVLWRAAGEESRVEAGTEVTIDSGGARRRAIPTAGREWTWAESLAPEIEIENRPLREFLEWFSRETGRKLVLADDSARSQAGRIRMHGDVRGLTAMEALSAVMASTTLHYELPEGAIRVSSARDSRPTS
jgi:ferric-dicitrate binding protein FerR (iron transport regulator)